MNSLRPLLIPTLTVLLIACGGGRMSRTDGGSGADGSTGMDGSAGTDGGGTARDSGTPIADAGPRMPTGTPEADEVRINETMWLQTMDGIGANAYAYPWADDLGWSWEATRYAFDEVDFRYIRLASWFEWWETENDNADPHSINWDGFGTVHDIIDNHDVPFASWLTERDVEVSLGVWNVGDWLASGSPRRVNPSMYDELGESITSYVLHMREAGVPQPFVEVQNEPGIEAYLQYEGPEALRDAALALLDQLDRNGLSDVMIHGPNYHAPSESAAWAEVWLANERLRSRTVAVSYHTWWDEHREPYDAIREVAERHGKPVWATEVGLCALPDGCFGNGHFLLPETWGTAWDFATSFYRAIAWTEATRVYHWSAVGNDGMVGPAGERYPTLSVVKHFANYIPPGAHHLESASGDDAVWVLPFLLPSGDKAVVLLNTDSGPRTMRVTSVRGDAISSVSGMTTSDGSHEATASPSSEGSTVTVTLPGQSVTSLRLQR